MTITETIEIVTEGKDPMKELMLNMNMRTIKGQPIEVTQNITETMITI